MIDERINNSLKELEQGLKNVESARKQVEKTVKSYDGLHSATAEYVNELGTISEKIQNLISSVGRDYNVKIGNFEKDRNNIVNSANSAIENLSNATDKFKDSLNNIQKKLNIYSILNAILTIVIGGIVVYILLKQ